MPHPPHETLTQLQSHTVLPPLHTFKIPNLTAPEKNVFVNPTLSFSQRRRGFAGNGFINTARRKSDDRPKMGRFTSPHKNHATAPVLAKSEVWKDSPSVSPWSGRVHYLSKQHVQRTAETLVSNRRRKEGSTVGALIRTPQKHKKTTNDTFGSVKPTCSTSTRLEPATKILMSRPSRWSQKKVSASVNNKANMPIFMNFQRDAGLVLTSTGASAAELHNINVCSVLKEARSSLLDDHIIPR